MVSKDFQFLLASNSPEHRRGAEPTWGQDAFARLTQNICVTVIFLNARIYMTFARKIFFPIFLGGGGGK